jgi:hypothetical protein
MVDLRGDAVSYERGIPVNPKPKPEALNSKPPTPQPSTMNPQPSTLNQVLWGLRRGGN